ncbi:MAG: cysteine synthase A [Candidatus Omnitrophica bacterium CG11_big_fil_rev_8_21_14_0_20_64_10]|nr:MAG: cysteine synthase A [Candidatus Omnitrophica bacterium CG11_big_fil_rev_8_21_14_0_20_64_10]
MSKRAVGETILDLIGETPLVRLGRMTTPQSAQVFGKLESMNPGGSVKDRIALAMVQDAEERGLLKPGGVIVEPTSGNTGIGLAMVSAVRGYRLILTLPEGMSTERISLLERFGAEVVITPANQGMAGAVKQAKAILEKTPDAFMPLQFANPANPRVHRNTTAQEILRALDGQVDAFVAGVGTGGTITGVGQVLKKKVPGVRVVAVEPKDSAVLSGKPPGIHRIQGIGAGFVPEILDRSVIDEIITIEDMEAYNMARTLSKTEGLLVGISAGANVVAALQVAKRLGPGKTVVTILCDTGERYLSLDPYFEEF